MEIIPNLSIVEPYETLYLENSGSACISDLHLGYEEALAEDLGVTLPTSQLTEVKRKFAHISSKCNPDKLIINGDLKHVFPTTSKQEWKEVPMFLDFILEFVDEIILVRGNHDTLLGPLKRFEEIKIVKSYREGDLVFVHGHTDFPLEKDKTIIIGHEHPVIILGDRVGARVKIPAFLFGSFEGRNLIVMPAFSPLAEGTEVNLLGMDFMSPILQKVNRDEMEAYAVDPSVGVLRFPELKHWQDFSLSL